MSDIGFACTTLNPEAKSLLYNIDVWEKNKIGPIAISLDRKSTRPSKLKQYYILFESEPETKYERLCPWDSYSRKNISFIRLIKQGVKYIFETDDDNKILLPGDKIASYFYSALEGNNRVNFNLSQNIFKDIYPSVKENIWARGFPINWLDHDNSESINAVGSDEKRDVGIVQFLVHGNPDVDAIFRLVIGSNININVDSEKLPVSLYNTFHPFNSQATLWRRDEFPLMYLPSTCDFRMTDIWRGYISQKALYLKNKTLNFEKPIVNQDRNEHRISSDFFGEYKGYSQSEQVVSLLRNMELNQDAGYNDIMRECYAKLVDIKVFEKIELTLLDSWLEAIS